MDIRPEGRWRHLVLAILLALLLPLGWRPLSPTSSHTEFRGLAAATIRFSGFLRIPSRSACMESVFGAIAWGWIARSPSRAMQDPGHMVEKRPPVLSRSLLDGLPQLLVIVLPREPRTPVDRVPRLGQGLGAGMGNHGLLQSKSDCRPGP